MRNNSAKQMALGGMLAALAVVLMCLVGLIPGVTFVTPMLSCLLLKIVLSACGRRIAWAWYGAVSLLSLLMGPDKEAAALFLFLGYYPIVKPVLDRTKASFLWKTLLFNASVFLMYTVLIRLFGMDALAAEFAEMGIVLLGITLVLGNVVFWLLDRILGGKIRPRR